MAALLTILFVSALLVLVAGGLLASDPCLNPPEAPRTFPGQSAITSRSAPGKLEAADDELWWRDWWINSGPE